jgi:hypothetical protein
LAFWHFVRNAKKPNPAPFFPLFPLAVHTCCGRRA